MSELTRLPENKRQKMRKMNLLLLKISSLLFVILTIIGCGACIVEKDGSANKSQNSLAKTDLEEPLQLSFASGGGFTGLASGYTIYSNGKINHWKRLSVVKDTVDWSTSVDASRATKFRTELVKSGLLERNILETGNMTTHLKYETTDSTYMWSWRGQGESGNVPVEIKDWYIEITKFCNDLKNN